MKAFVANTGIISAIGNNTSANLSALLEGRHGISKPEYLATKHDLLVGEIKQSNATLAQQHQLNSTWPRTALLSAIAAKEAWEPFKNKSTNLRIALISANTVGGMDKSESVFGTYLNDPISYEQHENFALHECGVTTKLTVEALGLDCFHTTISTACSSSANAIMLAAKLIKKDKYDVVIAGGADSLSKFTVNGFKSLMILDKNHCKPYDENRQGLNIGEAAAYLVLGNEKAFHQWQMQPEIYVSGYANANDAHHQTASSPEGIGNQLAINKALEVAQLKPEDIDYINLHGTGTVNNDASEGIAIERIFAQPPLASSTKPFTGHTLGAAGAIEAVYSILSLKEQKVWASINVDTPISNLNWQVTTKNTSQPVNHVLSNSFGFGGNCSAIILSKTK